MDVFIPSPRLRKNSGG